MLFAIEMDIQKRPKAFTKRRRSEAEGARGVFFSFFIINTNFLRFASQILRPPLRFSITSAFHYVSQ